MPAKHVSGSLSWYLCYQYGNNVNNIKWYCYYCRSITTATSTVVNAIDTITVRSILEQVELWLLFQARNTFCTYLGCSPRCSPRRSCWTIDGFSPYLIFFAGFLTSKLCLPHRRAELNSLPNLPFFQQHVIMRLRKPYTVATIWSSGKIWCTGASSLAKARQGARRIARRISKVGFPCRFSNYRIVNIMATCRLPFRVRLDQLVRERPKIMSYEPELAPGLNFKADKDSSTSLKLFSTGRIVIMGKYLHSYYAFTFCVSNVC
ncbi:unnamed protein product [Dibothriocephalus latus]|uniref:TATA box-binding protein-like 1 n=1 Tax=Dibothriocephalus latus TaxID=60516 RepID=A0A3P7L1Q8_DIBLA|nr:unnamed protein product [Dibothriocephalus latus]